MRILIHCPSFFPSVGGVESVAWLLAREFSAQGNQVRVFTETPAGDAINTLPEKVEIVRSNSYWKLWQEVAWCESYLQMGLSLKGVYPLAYFRPAWIVSHHTWYTPSNSPLNRLKRWLASFATNVFCSKAIATELRLDGVVIGNPYDSSVFRPQSSVHKKKNSLVFVGRLVSDKGTSMLIEAAGRLKRSGLEFELMIVGDGPERDELARLVSYHSLQDRVQFHGKLAPEHVAAVLATAQVLVVPSLWNEPFGVVALEAIACGCVVVGSSGGGLEEAIGPCGLTYPNRDINALTECLHRLLADQNLVSDLLKHSGLHLANFQPSLVASRYFEVLSQKVPPATSRSFKAPVS